MHATSDDVQLASEGLERHERERKVDSTGREMKKCGYFYIADSGESTSISDNNCILWVRLFAYIFMPKSRWTLEHYTHVLLNVAEAMLNID